MTTRFNARIPLPAGSTNNTTGKIALILFRLYLVPEPILVQQSIEGTPADSQGPGGVHLVALRLAKDRHDVPPLKEMQILRFCLVLVPACASRAGDQVLGQIVG